VWQRQVVDSRFEFGPLLRQTHQFLRKEHPSRCRDIRLYQLERHVLHRDVGLRQATPGALQSRLRTA